MISTSATDGALQIVKRPMDLRTMMNKLKQRSYDRPDQVVADAHLIFDNCRLYNEENSEICRVIYDFSHINGILCFC